MSSSSATVSFFSGGWGHVSYKLFSFTGSTFFFMNHAGSASGLSVCKTTNQEKFDLTQAGKFPSITRGKCWCSRERHRAGDRPRGAGTGQGAPVWALGGSGVGGRHPRAPTASASGAAIIPWSLTEHCPDLLLGSSGPCHTWIKAILPPILSLPLHTELLIAPQADHVPLHLCLCARCPHGLKEQPSLPKPDPWACPW